MRQWVQLVGLVSVLLAVPLLVTAIWGELLADDIARWQADPPKKNLLAAVVIGVLAADVLLPVPSGPVMTLAGAQLGTLSAIGVTWLGLTLGSTIAYLIGRYGGRPILARFVSERDLADLHAAATRHSLWVLLVTRPMPILAEASAIVAGMVRTPWWLFLAAIGVGNFVCSLLFCTLGSYAAANEWMTIALFLSIVVPVLLLVGLRHRLRTVQAAPKSHAEVEKPPR